MANRPEAEIEITAELVLRLLGEQFPELASLEVRELSRGWDNTNFRLGIDHIVRVPHRQVAAQLVTREQQWLPHLAAQLEMAIPAPTHVGSPTSFFPWPWSVIPWFEGDEAASVELTDSFATADALGTFFDQLHVAAPAGAPRNPYRGVPLADRTESFMVNVSRLEASYETTAMIDEFERACAVEAAVHSVWLHGDLHGRNMIVRDGALAAVIDWGDICTGDRATDLAGAYMVVPDHLNVVQQRSGSTDADWARARGWAMNFAAIYLAHSDDDPVMGSLGSRLIAALLKSH